MTSAEASSPPTAIASDAPALHSQASQIPIDPSTVNVDNRENVETTPTRSLFGPFPPSQEPSQADRHTADISEVKEVPISPPSDQIESSSKDEQAANQPNLNFNPHSQESSSPIQTNKSSGINNESLPPLLREKTAPAIGPATDKPTPVPKESEMEGPVLYITLLLSSTGARHPYKLDEKYLRKRNVVVDASNPINISLYKLKELILRDWREEWEAKPSSPESIRLISMGKLLNDKARLSDSGFKNGTTPHIIHMTIKPQEIVDEEDAKMKAAGNSRGENERSPGCRCVIQ